MGIAQLLDNAIDSAVSLFSGGTASLYIESGVTHALNKIQGENWKLDMGYAFEVEGSSGFKPFPLQINPTSIEQKENPTTVITPVQTGVCVEYQGFITKDLTISGTTGIQPGRSAGGVTGGVNFGLSTQIIPSGVPLFGGKWGGYMEIMLLRNYFRSYSEVKKFSKYKDLRLIFRNKKDNEHWYVEPIGPGIAISKNAQRPMLYDYNIELKIVGKATGRSNSFGGPLGSILDVIQTAENIVQDIGDTIDFFTGVVNGAQNFFQNFEKSIAITLLDPLKKIKKAIAAISNGKTTTSALPKQFYVDTATSLKRVRDNLSDWIGLGNTTYDITEGRISLTQQRSFILNDVNYLNAFNKMERALDRILASDVLFISNAGDTASISSSVDIDEAIAIASGDIVDNRIGSLSSLSNQFGGNYNFSLPSAVSQVSIELNETIERFAARVLGDATRANEIILLNNLDPPYVSEDTIVGSNTVKSGDLVLVPANETTLETSGVIKKRGTSRIIRELTTAEKDLGVDLRLTATNDLAVDTQIPDLKLIAGLNNAAQALGISIGVEKGSLLYHPNKGISPQIGKKDSLTAGELGLEIESSILSDKRFLALNELSVTRDGLSVAIGAVVSIRNLNKPVPLKLDVSNANNI